MSENNADPEDTGQISVAELLARNGQKTGGISAGGRRRRGVKGGISVAELTGEIPVVRADPKRDDAPVIATDTPEPPQQPQQTGPRSEPELLSGSTTAAGELLNQAHDESERRPKGSNRPVPTTSRRSDRDETAGNTAEGAAKPAEGAAKPAEGALRSSGFVARPRAKRAEADAEPKTDTALASDTATKSDAATKSETATKPGGTAKPQSGPKAFVPKPRVTPTTKTSDKASDKQTGQDEAAPETAKPKPAGPEKTQAAEKTESRGRVSIEKTPSDAEATPTEATPTEATPTETTPTEATPAAPAESGRVGKKDAAKQWAIFAGQGVVAIIVGALLFKGFERLWDMLPWVALILAVLVIVGLVAVVRILRRTDDLLSMVLAIAVGVFVTLGPLAFQLSTG